MQIQIREMKTSTHGTIYMDLQCNKKAAYVFIDKAGGCNVCTQNASHRAWQGMGRFFRSKEEALAGYKSAEVRAMIEAAFDAISINTSVAH